MARPRRNEYLAGDFLSENHSHKVETVDDVVDKKINLLYDFCILKRNGRTVDPREDTVRSVLTAIGSRCSTVASSEYAMSAALHDVLRYECTLEEMINRRR